MIRDLAALRALAERLRVTPGTRVTLPGDVDPGHTAGVVHGTHADDMLHAGVGLLAHYQARLAAQDAHGLLIVLQGLDASGKDGAIKHVMSGVNPQGVSVHRFVAPSGAEVEHDYLWRCTRVVPARGTIGIFNRSHYEEVVVTRVHPELLERQHLPREARGADLWERRFRQINDWERQLVENGIHIVKLFLDISRSEQRRRLLERIDDPDKSWKFAAADVTERRFWADYQRAYSEALSNTSTEWAPWYIVPADHKWFARLAVAAVATDALARIDPTFPVLDAGARAELARARAQLEAEHD